MSAIIAGEACKKCGLPYYLSFGHPKWWDDVMKRRKPKSEDFLEFEHMLTSGLCPNCYIESQQGEENEMADIGERRRIPTRFGRRITT